MSVPFGYHNLGGFEAHVVAMPNHCRGVAIYPTVQLPGFRDRESPRDVRVSVADNSTMRSKLQNAVPARAAAKAGCHSLRQARNTREAFAGRLTIR